MAKGRTRKAATTAALGVEQKLRATADARRNDTDVVEYEDVVLLAYPPLNDSDQRAEPLREDKRGQDGRPSARRSHWSSESF